MTKSKIFFWLGVCFIAGIFLGRYFDVNLFWKIAAIDLIFIILFVFWKNKVAYALCFCVAFLILGFWRYEISKPKFNQDWIQYYNEKNVNLLGIVDREPDIREEKLKLTVGKIKIKENNKSRKLKGNILIDLQKYPEFKYGDMLFVSGKMLEPKVFDDFNYKDYLSRYGIYSVSYNPKAVFISKNNGSKLINFVILVKHKFLESINKILPEPQAGLLAGLILGDKSGLSPDLVDKFNKTGISHIIVVSGYHVTIISGILFGAFLLYFKRRTAFVLAIFGLIIFIILTGFQASAIRATIMGAVVLLAVNMGRVSEMRNVLLLVGIIMLVVNPLILSFDIGFQLSFLATVGIIYLAPYLKKKLTWIYEAGGIREIAAMTFSAQIFVLPILLFNFKRVSLIAPITNLLVLPFVPLTMLIGFIAGVFGLFWVSFGKIIGFFAWMFLTYQIKIVEIFSKIPLSTVETSKIWVGWAVVYYLILIFVLIRLKKLKR